MPTHWMYHIPDCKVHVANMGPIWGRQDPGGPYVVPRNFAIWDSTEFMCILEELFICWSA